MSRFLCSLICGAVLAVVSGAVLAQDMAPPPSEITFRRVTPPGPDHSGPRINIRIEPRAAEPEAEDPVAEAPITGGAEDDENSISAAAWFWDAVPSGLDGAGRVQAAMRHLARAPETTELNIARLSELNLMASDYGRQILAATIGTNVSPALVLAVMSVESRGRPDAESGAGAQGLMQLIPATADRFNVADPFDPEQNIAGGVAYLAWLLEEFDGDPVLALAGYNAGEGAVRRAGGVPNYDETRAYVPKVLATWALTRGLCLSPPELITDGCVFATLASD